MIQNKYVDKDKKIKIKYLENRFVQVRGILAVREISGRRLSLANDIREAADANAAALNKRKNTSA